MPISASGQGSVHASGSAGAHVALGPVLEAPERGYAIFSTPVSDPAVTGSKSCDTVRDTLLKAGWIWTGNVQASVTLAAPFGWGFTSFQRDVTNIGDGTRGIAFFFYDPRVEDPPTGWLGGITGGYLIQAVPAATSSAVSELNLVNAINLSAAGVVATIQDANTILLTAKPIGTQGNGIQVQGNGSISVGGTTTGGGWVLQSRSQTSVEFFGNQADIQLTVQTGAAGNGNVQLVLVINGTTTTFPLGSYQWRLIADTYQACFMGIEFLGGEDIYSANNYLWCATPMCDSADGSAHVSNAAFIGSGTGFSSSLGDGNAHNNVQSWVNGTYLNGGQGTAWAMAMLHSEAGVITDLSDQVLIQKARVALKASAGLRFVGYVGNAFVSSAPATVGEQIAQLSAYFRCVASQNNPPGSVWLMTAETTGDTPTGSGTPTPKNAVGIGNVVLGGSGSFSILTSTNGDPFDRSMVGKTLTITGIPQPSPVANGQSYTVIAVADATHLNFDNPFVIWPLTGINWEIQLS